MNWKSAKWIIIVLLAALNVFLITQIIRSEQKQTRLSSEMIEDAVQVLLKQGIEVAPDTIPNEYYYLPTLSCDNTEASRLALVQQVLGEDYRFISNSGNETEENYESDTLLFTLDHNFNFKYHLKSEYSIEETAQQKVLDLTRDIMAQFGLSQKEYMVTDQWVANSITYLKLRQVFNQFPLYGFEMNVSITGGQIVEMSGRIAPNVSQTTESFDARDAVNVLFYLADSTNGSPLGTVHSIAIGYNASSDAEQGQLSLFPTWMMEVGDAHTAYYYDTVTGTLRQGEQILKKEN